MAKELPYFKFISTEWLTGSIAMDSFEVQGLFINVCALYWKNTGSLSVKEIEQRYKKKKLINEMLEKYTIVKDGMVSIQFLDEQLGERQYTCKKNKENIESRWSKIKENVVLPNNTTVQNGNTKSYNIEEEIEKEKEEEIEEEQKGEKVEILELYPFEEFWETYNKKIGRSDCEKKFKKISEAEKSLIWDHVPKYVDSTTNIQFRMHPATYLNGKHWNDEIIIEAKQNGKQQGLNTEAVANVTRELFKS